VLAQHTTRRSSKKENKMKKKKVRPPVDECSIGKRKSTHTFIKRNIVNKQTV
jgi:hypothetical protein